MAEKIADLTKEEAERILREGWKKFDWEAHCNRTDEKIAPQMEEYRIARLKSYAEGKYHVFI